LPSDDPNHLTGKFLDRVLKRADAPGMLSYQRGYCNNIFRINYDDGGYEELKQVQRMQEEEAGEADEVLLSLTCQLSNLHLIAIILHSSLFLQPMGSSMRAGVLICCLESDNDALALRLERRDAEHAAALAAVEGKHAAAVEAMKKTESTLRDTVKIREDNYAKSMRLQDVERKFMHSEYVGKTTKAVEKALSEWKVRGLAKVRAQQEVIAKLELELAGARLPRDAGEKNLLALEGRVRNEVAEKNKIKTAYDEMMEQLDGETVLSIFSDRMWLESDVKLYKGRSDMLQINTTALREEIKVADALVLKQEQEIWQLNFDMKLDKKLIAYLRLQRRYDTKEVIYHDEGKIIVKCTMCLEVSWWR
jgi:hypothetical protein